MNRPDRRQDELLRWFQPFQGFGRYQFPHDLGEVADLYSELAKSIDNLLYPSPERTEALRYLLISRDAAVRALADTPYEESPTPQALAKRNAELKEELGS
jgi:hypothetical protein